MPALIPAHGPSSESFKVLEPTSELTVVIGISILLAASLMAPCSAALNVKELIPLSVPFPLP